MTYYIYDVDGDLEEHQRGDPGSAFGVATTLTYNCRAAIIEDKSTGKQWRVEPYDEEHEIDRDGPRQRYKIVFRNSTVVDERVVVAYSMTHAAEIATWLTWHDEHFKDWSVYSITMTL